MIWGALSLLVGMLYAAQSEINKKFKIDGFKLNTYRSLISFLILLPFISHMEWPVYPEYYLFIIAAAAVNVLGMMAQYNLAAKHSGRVSSLHQPLAAFFIFSFWLLIDAEQIVFLQNNFNKTAAILCAFVMFVLSLQYIRKRKYTISVLMSVLPISILYSLMIVISKVVLEKGVNILYISLNFVFLSNVIMFLLSVPVMFILYKKKHILDRKAVKCAIPVSIYHTVSWIFICLAIIITDNPAYPIILASLTPLWFMIYYKVRDIKDTANPIAGAFLAVAALILLAATAG